MQEEMSFGDFIFRTPNGDEIGRASNLEDLAEMIAGITSFKGEIIWDLEKPDGTYQKLLDVKKLEKLGWTSRIPLKEGLEKTYEDYKKELKLNTLRNK